MEEEEFDWNKAKEEPETLERIEYLRLKNLIKDLEPDLSDDEEEKEPPPLL